MNRILVLEDDENLRELLVEVLDSLDYQVEGAECAEVALHLASEIDFDLVISDIRMAGPTDGLGALEIIKKRRPQIACIVMTGYADELAPLKAVQIRVDDYLYKPFAMSDIVAAMERVKKSAEQNRWYRRTLSRLLGQGAPEQRLSELQQAREQALKSFFVAVRSGLLYAETALAAWDALEELELGYLSSLRSPSSLSNESVAAGRQRYQSWQQHLEHKVEKGTFVTAGQRSPEKVERPVFKRFLDRVKSGEVTAEELALAVGLRRMPAERRAADEEHQRLWQKLWN